MPVLKEQSTSPMEITTLLGRGSAFEGKLTFEGAVRIDGRFKGDVFTDGTLVIGENAEIQAEIEVGTVIIEGSITGNVRAKQSVEVRAPARVRGNIMTPSLFIEKGVIFDGNCQMDGSASTVRTGPPAPPPGRGAASTGFQAISASPPAK